MTRRSVFWSGLGAGLLWVGTSWAEPSPADRATARALAGEGYQALQEKDYASAADRFGRADALVHAPTLMIDWARSLVGLGKLVEAQERYEQIVREGVDAKAPKSWRRALTDAASELAQLKPRLAWITISVSGAEDPHVTIDGVVVPPAAIGVRRAVNPGPLDVRVQAKGFLGQNKTVELKEGAEEAAEFRLEPDPEARAVVPVKAPEPAPTPVKSHNPTAMYVAFGVSAAGLAVGMISGGLFLSKRSDLNGVCNSDHACESVYKSDVDAYHKLGTVSTVGFAVGVVGAGVGLTLAILNRNTGNPAPAQGVAVHPYIGLGSVGATGSF